MNNRYIFRGKRKDNGEWAKGSHLYDEIADKHYIIPCGNINESQKVGGDGCCYCVGFEVIPDTVGQYTGLTDKNGKKIFEGDIVRILNFQIGVITNECGTFGIAVYPSIDWDYLDSEIAEVTGCDNMPYFCRNDNFISLFELMWNYNQEEQHCEVVEIIGNIHDNPDLLEAE